MKIMTIIGARPQFIKAAPVSFALKAAGLIEFILHTGQHYDQMMSDVFFKEMGIPKPDLNIDVGSGSHGYQTGQMLIRIEQALMDESPDRVLIYGDTNSTLAGALAARKLHIPVAHVEAGLRSFDRDMPEEINRIVTDALSDFLFVTEQSGLDNLKNEGYLNINRTSGLDKVYLSDKYLKLFEEDIEKLKENILNEYYHQ